jgi:hypothetical protein
MRRWEIAVMRRRLINGLIYLSIRAEPEVVPELVDAISSACCLRAAVVESSKLDTSDSRFFSE